MDFMSGEPSAHGMCLSHGATRASPAPGMSAQACLCSESLQLESARFGFVVFFFPPRRPAAAGARDARLHNVL